MKDITMRIQKFSRPGVILMATVVAIITSMVVANATQTITAPNAAFVSYSLAAGTNSAAITPVTNKSVLVMGCSAGPGLGILGVGQVSLLHIANYGILWVGLESTPSAAITQGLSGTAGDHIVWIDFNHKVDIQVASVDTIRVHNGNNVTVAGNVTLVW
jgi:hypothetical protein